MSVSFSPARIENHDGREICVHDSSIFDVNVNNRNCFLLLTELGFEPDYCGTVEVGLLMAAITVKQEFPSGIMLATIQEGNFIDCGVDADYVPRQFKRLIELCEYCVAEGYSLVGWA